ncbi:hypothetical protein L9F63_021397, partial [Diploptera punctata]
YLEEWTVYRKFSLVQRYRYYQIPVRGDPGDPLFLTPYIEAGKIKEAQQLSKVGPLKGAANIKSYSGYLTVDKTYNSNLFFWYFPIEREYADAPVVLWLQGGPGATSLYGLFTENGPFSINKKFYLVPREYSWTKTHHVIYIDNPVGTEKSAIVAHACSKKHRIETKAKLLKQLDKTKELKIWKKIYIHKNRKKIMNFEFIREKNLIWKFISQPREREQKSIYRITNC